MRRIPLLITIFTTAILLVAAVVIGLLYQAAVKQQAALLAQIADSQARTVEGIARNQELVGAFVPDSLDYGSALSATLAQLRDINSRFAGFGRTGEFALGRREGDSIIYLLNQRHPGPRRTEAIPFTGPNGEPMRRALSGRTGTVVGPDYRGVTVLAAYAPVNAFGMGVVAKVDLAEVRAPFIRAGLISIVAALVVVLIGSLLFFVITNPVLVQLRASSESLRRANSLLEAVTTGTEVIVAAVDTDYRYLFFNAAYGEEIKRLGGKDLKVGASMKDVFAHMPELQRAAMENWSRTLRGEVRGNYRVEFGDPGRYRRTYSVRQTLIRGAGGEVMGAGETASDITEQVRAEVALRENAARLATILEATQESIWLFGTDGEILAGNRTAAARLRLTPADVVGKHFRDVLPADLSAARLARLNEVVDSGRPLEFEDDRAGMTFRHSFYPVTDENGRVTAVASFSRDITERRRTEVRLREQSMMLASANDAIIGYDAGYHVTFWNRSAERLYGYSEAEAMGRVSTELFHPVYVGGVTREQIVERISADGHVEVESIRTTHDGRQIYVEAHVIVLRDEQGNTTGYVSVDRDITERKRSSERVARLARLYAVLSRVNESIVRIRDAGKLYDEVCRIVSEEGGFPLAWIGLVDGTQVKPVACCGPACDYLKEIRVEIEGDLGRGPTGTSIREDRTVVNDDFSTNPATIPWRLPAQRYGFHASASFPLHQSGEVIGAFVLYASDPSVFDEEHVRLFQALSADVSFALDALEHERLRVETEQALREAKENLELRVRERTSELTAEIEERKLVEQRLAVASQYSRSLIEASLDPLVTINSEGRITDVNEATVTATGATRVELIGTDFSEYFTEPDKAREGYRRVFAECSVTDYPLTIRHRDGHLIDVLYNASVYRDTRGEVTGVFAAARDVTERKRAEAAVVAERQRLHDVLNLLPAYVILLAPDHTVPFANRFFEERFGKSGGRRCYDYLFHRIEPCENCESYTVMKTKGPHHWEWLGPDGRNYDISDFPFTDADGSQLIMEVGLDVTEQKRAEAAVQAERKRFLDVLESLPAMICLLSPDYHVVFANRAFRDQFGEADGRRCYEYCFGQPAPCTFCQSFTPLKTGKPHHWEVELTNGTVISAFDMPFTDADGSRLILEMDLDITAFRRAEAALREAHNTLETKVAERTAELSRSNAELEQFAYVASHDLQQPLRMVASYVELLAQRYQGRLDEKADKYIDYAVGGSKRMQILIDALLRYSRANAGTRPVQPVDLGVVIGRARENLALALADSGGQVVVDGMPTVCGDEILLTQLFQNLIENAIKFRSAEPPVVRVDAETRGRGDGVRYYPRFRQRYRDRAAAPGPDIQALPASSHRREVPRHRHRARGLQEDCREPRRHHSRRIGAGQRLDLHFHPARSGQHRSYTSYWSYSPGRLDATAVWV